MSRDHSGTLTLTHHAVEAVHPVDNMAAKYRNKIGCTANGLSVFKFRVASSLPGDFDIDAVQSLGPVKIKLRFYAPTAPVWGANSTLAVSPDRCEVFPDREYKQVRFTVDFGAGPYPVEGWRFEHGTTKGILSKVQNPVGQRRDLVLRMKVHQTLDVTLPIKFMTSSQSVEIFNVCFVQKGGAGAPANSGGTPVKGRMVEKESISSVDFSGPEYALFGGDEFYDPLHHLIDFYDSQIRAPARQGASDAIDQTAEPLLKNQPGKVNALSTSWGDEGGIRRFIPERFRSEAPADWAAARSLTWTASRIGSKSASTTAASAC